MTSMTQYDRMALGRQAKDLGFVRDTLEKVRRLTDVLGFLEQDEALRSRLALKGGTAINLTIFDIPRLSVDIDLDFAENLSRGAMLEQRGTITDRIRKHMAGNGYSLSQKSKLYHALDSLVFEYQNTGGMKDNLKIEINYMLRCHIMDVRRRALKLPWLNRQLTVLSVDPVEIFASKIVALINRAAPRDLYDLSNMLKYSLFDDGEQEMLRKCVVFYSAIGSEETPESFSFDSILALRQNKIKSDLLPVLKTGVFFDVKESQVQCVDYLKELLSLTEQERAFLQAFQEKQYRPELLFTDDGILERISKHPMALWKCGELSSFTDQPSEKAGGSGISELFHMDYSMNGPPNTPARKKDLER